MKTTMFKVHSVYSKEDILEMEKVATQKLRRRSLAAAGVVLILYVAMLLWGSVKIAGHIELAALIPNSVLDVVILVALFCTFVMMISMPYHRRNKVLKEVPGGVLKANYYFYEKTFQYGWGNDFRTIAYMNVQEFRSLPTAFFIKTDEAYYWVKKVDFEIGTPEDFYNYMKKKVTCKIIEK